MTYKQALSCSFLKRRCVLHDASFVMSFLEGLIPCYCLARALVAVSRLAQHFFLAHATVSAA
jgi:hypothetical protein